MSKKRKQQDDVPKPVKPFACLNDFTPGSDDQWVGDCPACGKERHLRVDPATGKWDCKRCGESGNHVDWLETVYAAALEVTPPARLKALAKRRGLPVAALKKVGPPAEWRGEWIFPVRNPKTGRLCNLRRYDGKQVKAVWGLRLQAIGVEQLGDDANRAWIVEGEWDAAALRYALRKAGRARDVVVALPGASNWRQDYADATRGLEVAIATDADPPGERAAAKIASSLRGLASGVRQVRWGENATEGRDVNDVVAEAVAAGRPMKRVVRELERSLTKPKPEADPDVSKVDAPEGEEELPDPIPLSEVMASFDRWLEMDDDMRDAVRLSLAVCMSNEHQSDPLWLFLIGPPSSGKTALLKGLYSSHRCVFRSTLTAHILVSGWRGGDPSLVPRLSGKTFVLKDFTEILTKPQLEMDDIFGTLRGCYDGHVEKEFGNGVQRFYNKNTDPPFHGFSLLAGVTPAIHGRAESHLGERFLKFEMKPTPTLSATRKAIANVGREQQMEDELAEKCRAFLARGLPDPPPSVPQWFQDRAFTLARVIAVARTHVERDWKTEDINYRPQPEAPVRLVKQLISLGMMLAATRDRREVDEEDFRLVARVAKDTAAGFTLDVMAAMASREDGASRKEIADDANVPSSTARRRIDDLIAIGVVDTQKQEQSGPGRPAATYRLKPDLRQMVNAMTGEQSCSSGSKDEGREGPGKRHSRRKRSGSAGKRQRKSEKKGSAQKRSANR